MYLVLVILILLGLFSLINKFAERCRESRLSLCSKHNVRRHCGFCDLEASVAIRDKEEQAKLSIDREYWLIPDDKRHQLRQLAEEHIKRNSIATGRGSIELAVVNMWRRSHDAKNLRVAEDRE